MNTAAAISIHADPGEWDAAQARILTAFVATLEHAPRDALILALKQQCKNGFGDWLVPEDATSRHLRPATHLVEIRVFGVPGVGFTEEQAARNWRKAALATTQGRKAE